MKNMEPILLVAAVRQELDSFLAKGMDPNVRILFTGMGRQRASESVRKQLAKEKYRLVISTGFAGGTCPGFKVGDLVMASEVKDAGSQKRWQPGRVMTHLRQPVAVGTLVTAERICSDPISKEKLGILHGAIGVDLETAMVAEAASQAGIPWLAIRSILDPMEVSMPISSGLQAFTLLLMPSRWPDFKNFLGAVRVASQSLSNGLESLISNVSQNGGYRKGEETYGS